MCNLHVHFIYTCKHNTAREGVEVEVDGELYIDLGTGQVPTGPTVPPGCGHVKIVGSSLLN